MDVGADLFEEALSVFGDPPSGLTACFDYYKHYWSETCRYLFSNIFTTYVPHAFIFSHRNHQCGLQLVIWQDAYRSPPSLSCPLSPSLPSVPPSPLPLSIFSLIPLSPSSKIHHAYQGVPHPHAHECGGVPHRPALYDPGEATTPCSSPNSHPHTRPKTAKWYRKQGMKTSSQRGDTFT